MSIDTQAYLFVHFIGEERNPTDEQLYFALSRDGVHWCATHVVDSTLWPPI